MSVSILAVQEISQSNGRALVMLRSDGENRRHAEIFCSLTLANVTPVELEVLATDRLLPFTSSRYQAIHRILERHGALAQLPELARRCAVVPEVLLDRPIDDLEKAIEQRLLFLTVEDLLTGGYLEVRGRGADRQFRITEKGLREWPTGRAPQGFKLN